MTSYKSNNEFGIVFPVARIDRYLKKGKGAKRVSPTASIFLSSVLDYLCVEVLELAGNACKENNKKRITPRHLALAIRQDEELNTLIQNATIPSGGVLPNIHSVLLPKRSSAPIQRISSISSLVKEMNEIE